MPSSCPFALPRISSYRSAILMLGLHTPQTCGPLSAAYILARHECEGRVSLRRRTMQCCSKRILRLEETRNREHKSAPDDRIRSLGRTKVIHTDKCLAVEN